MYRQDCFCCFWRLRPAADPGTLRPTKKKEVAVFGSRKNVEREVGSRLRDARKAVLMSQSETARELSKTRQALSRWERGRAWPSLLEFRELALLYGESTDWLLFGIRTAPLGGGVLQDIFREREAAEADWPYGL